MCAACSAETTTRRSLVRMPRHRRRGHPFPLGGRRAAMLDIVTLSLGAGAGALASRALAKLREHRTEPAGVADLLNWGFLVDDGPPAIVLQKDGSLLAGWEYRGPDLSAATAEELDALSAHVNDALLPFSDNWMFHIDAIRRPASAYRRDAFPDSICQLIDDE